MPSMPMINLSRNNSLYSLLKLKRGYLKSIKNGHPDLVHNLIMLVINDCEEMKQVQFYEK